MTFITRLAVPFVAAAALSATPAFAADGKVLATVNGKAITEQDMQRYVRNNQKGEAMDEQSLLNEMISRELVYQDALKKGLDKDPGVQEQIENLRTNIILGAALEQAVQSQPVGDDELKKLYDEQVAQYNVTEYKARHILLKSKEDAEKVITELDMGGDFADLAKKRSTGPSAKQGGDLGWFAPQQMVPEFSQAVAGMEKGNYTKAPVQTQFGWHVIKLEDSRNAEPPSFEQVKPKILQMVEQQRLGDYIKGLRDDAKVDVKK